MSELRDSIAGALSGAQTPHMTGEPARLNPDAGHGAGDGFPGSDFDPVDVLGLDRPPGEPAMHPDAALHLEASASFAAASARDSGFVPLLRDDGSPSGMFAAAGKPATPAPALDAAQLLDVLITCLEDGYDVVDGARREFGYDDLRFADVRHGFIFPMFPVIRFLEASGFKIQPKDPDRKIDFTPPPQLFVLLADVQTHGRMLADFIGVGGGQDAMAARGQALKLADDAKLIQTALTTIAKRVPFPDTTPPEVPAGREEVLLEFSKTRTANGLDADLKRDAADWLLFIRQKCREVESAIAQGDDSRPTMIEVANLALLLVDTTTRKGGPRPVLKSDQVAATVSDHDNGNANTGGLEPAPIDPGDAGRGRGGTAEGGEPAPQAEGAGAGQGEQAGGGDRPVNPAEGNAAPQGPAATPGKDGGDAAGGAKVGQGQVHVPGGKATPPKP